MFLIDLLGAALTLVAGGFLALGGYLAALRLLREEAVRDPLALAIATLLLATAEAVGIALLLGSCGLLRIDFALALQAALALALLVGFRRSPPPGGLGAPARAIFPRSWALPRAHAGHPARRGERGDPGAAAAAALLGQLDVPPAARRDLAAGSQSQSRLRQHPQQLLR